MSFRRNRDDSSRWHQWKFNHAESLIALGLPRELFDRESNWLLFLQEGYFIYGYGEDRRFGIQSLTGEQQAKLLGHLSKIVPSTERNGQSVFHELNKSLAKAL